MRVLILYTELAGYVMSNIRYFLNKSPESEVLLVSYPVNNEAPFVLDKPDRVRSFLYLKEKEDELMSEIVNFNPDVALCSGWGNRYYLKIISSLQSGTSKVLCFDNQWKGNFKQRLNVLLDPFGLRNLFNHVWVPGLPQKEYALRLGFKDKVVHTGLYPADTSLYLKLGEQKLKDTNRPFPRVFICIARYISQKDLPTLWKAFLAANSGQQNKWKLICLGLGELFEERVTDPSITHLGFVQPSEINNVLANAGFFVLPSLEEPWGVVVHEMALSAIPLVLSDRVGAGTMFLNENNGYSFRAGDEQQLQSILSKIMMMNDDELWQMARSSFQAGGILRNADWAATLEKIHLSRSHA